MTAQRIILLIVTLFAVGLNAQAQRTADPPAPTRDLDAVMSDYIRAGLQSNLALQEQEISYQRSIQALVEARGAYLPSLTLEGRYSRADGGRTIDLPIGSIINPIYATLNRLTRNQSPPGSFPPVADQQFALQRTREQQTAMRVSQPLYAPKLAANLRLQQANSDAAQYTRDAFKAALVHDICIAYLGWNKSGEALAITASSLDTLTENLRVNRKLYEAGKVTEDQVLRAEAELLSLQQQQVEADNTVHRAQRYFNFLLNRERDAPLERADLPAVATLSPVPVERLIEDSLNRRAELRQLKSQQAAAAASIDAARAEYKPTLGLALEGGTQGENYRFGRDDRYALGSIVFSWSLFSGNQTRARVGQARLAAKSTDVQLEQTRQRIGLQVEQAREDLIAAMNSLKTADARRSVAGAAFKIASKKRDAGVISQVEFLDARSTLADAQSNFNLTRFDVFARATELDYAAGLPALHIEVGP